jgi:23S rRNA (adenine2503-C2)-methyltransferase
VSAASERPDLTGLELHDLEARFGRLGIPAFHARQVFRWVHKRGVTELGKMSDLSRDLRARLAREFSLSAPRIVSRGVSTDGTQKLLLELADGRRIESVFIPETPSMTFCISSQVGCAMDCAFCLTGKMGFVRHLTAGEIVAQVRMLAVTLGLLEARFNVVLMGMGEPLHNYEPVLAAFRILCHEHGLAMSPRRITLSTVGLVPAIDRLAREPLMPNLAISLHATTDGQRSAIVPVNRKYSLQDVIAACRRIPLRRRDRLTFEYVLLDGVNDTPEDARRLVKLLAQVKGKVNLIPLNAAPGIEFERPSDACVDRFARVLANHGVTVSVRKSRGRDIRAACGQLIVEGQRKSTAQQAALLMESGSG